MAQHIQTVGDRPRLCDMVSQTASPIPDPTLREDLTMPTATTLPRNAPATCTWSLSATGYLRTVTPARTRTIWTITHIFADGMGDLTAVVDGTLTRSAAIARVVGPTRGPNDVIIATHSVVR